jgi:hypothetical protein
MKTAVRQRADNGNTSPAHEHRHRDHRRSGSRSSRFPCDGIPALEKQMTFQRKWASSFPYKLVQGDWPGRYGEHWDAYPTSYPDTATQENLPVGGYYDPQVISASGGYMNLRMYRSPSGGSVHSCAIIPRAASGHLYGRYTAKFRVSKIAAGYKSAHLLWPSDGNQNTETFEVDYPEGEWDTTLNAYVHSGNLQQLAFDTGASWDNWHETVIAWSPGSLVFSLDGVTVFATIDTRYIPNVPMDWIIQNESALNGESAAPGSSANIQIQTVAFDEWIT